MGKATAANLAAPGKLFFAVHVWEKHSDEIKKRKRKKCFLFTAAKIGKKKPTFSARSEKMGYKYRVYYNLFLNDDLLGNGSFITFDLQEINSI